LLVFVERLVLPTASNLFYIPCSFLSAFAGCRVAQSPFRGGDREALHPAANPVSYERQTHMKTSSRISMAAMLIAVFTLGWAPMTFAQEDSVSHQVGGFARKGVVELGGGITFQSLTPVQNDQTDDAITVFLMMPYIGYFVTDGFQIGVNPLGIGTMNYKNESTTAIMALLAPSYNFSTGGSAYPFVELLLGYTALSNGTERSGFTWGGRGGAKIEVGESGLLNLAVQYLQITTTVSGASKRTGLNQFAVSAGFTVWL
jgi:hypothetical protein